MNAKQFREFIIERDGDHEVNFHSIMRQWESANILSQDSVSIDVLKETMDKLYANKRKIQKRTKTDNK